MVYAAVRLAVNRGRHLVSGGYNSHKTVLPRKINIDIDTVLYTAENICNTSVSARVGPRKMRAF